MGLRKGLVSIDCSTVIPVSTLTLAKLVGDGGTFFRRAMARTQKEAAREYLVLQLIDLLIKTQEKILKKPLKYGFISISGKNNEDSLRYVLFLSLFDWPRFYSLYLGFETIGINI